MKFIKAFLLVPVFLVVIFLSIGCNENFNEPNHEKVFEKTQMSDQRGLDPGSAGGYSNVECSMQNVVFSEFESLCDYQNALLDALNSCSHALNSQFPFHCVGVTDADLPGDDQSTHPGGSIVVDSGLGSNLALESFLPQNSLMACGNCEAINFSPSGYLNCHPGATFFPHYTGQQLEDLYVEFLDMAYEYGTSSGCGDGLVLYPESMEFYFTSTIGCSTCEQQHGICPDGQTGWYIPFGCGKMNLHVRIAFHCCSVI